MEVDGGGKAQQKRQWAFAHLLALDQRRTLPSKLAVVLLELGGLLVRALLRLAKRPTGGGAMSWRGTRTE